MASDPQSQPLALPSAVSCSALVVALVELAVVVSIPPRSGGANIGLGLAVFTVLAAGVAAAISMWTRTRQPGVEAMALKGIGLSALVLAVLMILIVGVGIVEELQ